MGDLKNMTLGINGLGRVGKFFLWTQLFERKFLKIRVNFGREVGIGLQSIIDYVLHDSTYGKLSSYLFGLASGKEVLVEIINKVDNEVRINGVHITFLITDRDPCDVQWGDAEIIVDTTGQFNDLSDYSDQPVLGYFNSKSVQKVVLSSPPKFDKEAGMLKEAVTLVLGVNDDAYNPKLHKIISAASCTTTCLSYMLKDPLTKLGVENLKSMAVLTIHAWTGKQQVQDRPPKKGESDPVRYRAVQNNVFISGTGAVKTLGLVMPEISNVPFSGDSIRIPTNTGSLVACFANWDLGGNERYGNLSVDALNEIYQEVATSSSNEGRLRLVDRPLVSTDIIGGSAAAVVEGSKTSVMAAGNSFFSTVVYAWYDNELGSFVNILKDQVIRIARSI